MGFPELLYLNGRVLGVVFGDVKLELLRYLLCVDSCRNASLPFVQHSQDSLIHVVVNEDDTGLGTLDKTETFV